MIGEIIISLIIGLVVGTSFHNSLLKSALDDELKFEAIDELMRLEFVQRFNRVIDGFKLWEKEVDPT